MTVTDSLSLVLTTFARREHTSSHWRRPRRSGFHFVLCQDFKRLHLCTINTSDFSTTLESAHHAFTTCRRDERSHHILHPYRTRNTSNKSTKQRLPNELIQIISRLLPLQDLVRSMRVCKWWTQDLIGNDRHLRRLLWLDHDTDFATTSPVIDLAFLFRPVTRCSDGRRSPQLQGFTTIPDFVQKPADDNDDSYSWD